MSPATEPASQSSLTCFVIGPIGNRLAAVGSPERQAYEESLRVMAEVIEPACSHHGLSPVRADSLARAGEITEQIFRRLRDDDVVIADLTGANANVMYELGLRHTRDKLTVQIGEGGYLSNSGWPRSAARFLVKREATSGSRSGYPTVRCVLWPSSLRRPQGGPYANSLGRCLS